MITSRNKLALTSKKPGKTIKINHFLINEKWYLVDLPGYGFAHVSHLQREMWLHNIQEYFIKRKNLKNVFLLVDASIPPQKADIEFTNWLGKNMVPFCIVFTKTDKAKTLQMQKNIEDFKTELLKIWEELPTMLTSSTLKEIGRKEILDYINLCLAIK